MSRAESRANKRDIQEMLVAMGFGRHYIQRAFKVYQKSYGHNFKVELIIEIILRLQIEDEIKNHKKKNQSLSSTNQDPQMHQINSTQIQKAQKQWKKLKHQLLIRNDEGCPAHGNGDHLALKSKEYKLYLQCVQCNEAILDHVDIPKGFGNIYLDNSKSVKSTSTNQRHHKTLKAVSYRMPPFPSHMTLQRAQKLEVGHTIDHRDQAGRFAFATVIEKQGTNLKIHYEGWSQEWDTWSDFSKEIHRFAVAESISKRRENRGCSLQKGYYVDINPSLRHPGWKSGQIQRLDQKSGQVQVLYEGPDKNYLYWTHLDNEAEIAEFGSISKAELLISGYIHKNDCRVPKEIKSLFLMFYGSIWAFTGQGCPKSYRDKVVDALGTKNRELESLFLSLDEQSVMNMDWEALMARIQRNYDDTIQCVRSCSGTTNGEDQVSEQSALEMSDTNDEVDDSSSECMTNHLQQETEEIPPFPLHITFQDALKLKVNDKIDHQDFVGRFQLSTVVEKQGTNLKIHYDGWSRKWDRWSDFSEEIHRFAVAESISRRPSHRATLLKTDDFVDINRTVRHPGWKRGKILKFDQKSGQVHVGYKFQHTIYRFWTHLDDVAKIAEFKSIPKVQLLISGFVRKADKRTPTEIISICFDYYGSFWRFRTRGQRLKAAKILRMRQKRIIDSLYENHRQLESIVYSLDRAAVAKLERSAVMTQIQNNHSDTLLIIQSCIVNDNDQVSGNDDSDYWWVESSDDTKTESSSDSSCTKLYPDYERQKSSG